MNLIFAILGIFGGIIAGTGDMLLDLKGKGNQKLGTSKNIDSNWLKMSEWRFRASVICGMIGCPLGGLGYMSLANQIESADYTLAFVFKLAIFVGIMGGFFIHTFLSIQPIIYKRIMKTNQFDLADDVLEGGYAAIIVPFLLLYLILAFVPTICMIIAVLKGYLDVPKWMVLMNPIVTTIVGWILRAINRNIFYEMPAIIMSNVGVVLMCLVSVVSILG